MSESGKVSLPMTPERIEAYKAYSQINRGLPPEMAIELLAALEESQQAITALHEYNHRYAKERDEAKKDLAEAQQTIARQQEAIIQAHKNVDKNNENYCVELAEKVLREAIEEGTKEGEKTE